jgi:hypothetical protein
MKWHVTGADARTGEDRTVLVEAATAADAETVARQAGYLVSHVSEAPRAAVAPPAADPLAELAAAASSAPAAFAYLPPARAQIPDHAVPVPEYWGLRFGSIAFLVFAGVFYLGGLLGLLAGVAMLVNSLNYSSGLGVLAALGQFLLSLWPLALGTVFHALSSACIALRDIARNSFAG